MNMALGDRMKRYEESFHTVLVRRSPVIVRVDGRAFHTLTSHAKKPFDHDLMEAMVKAATDVSKEMQGFKVAYIQSDEASFCITDYNALDTQGWFDYDLSKVVSISAALMSVAFNLYYPTRKLTVFDSRAFVVPIDDVANAFLWRAKDWARSSLQMYARSFFSQKQLLNKKRSNMHEMLHTIGKNWATDLTDQERNGTFLIGTELPRYDILPNYESVSSVVNPLLLIKADLSEQG